MKVSRCIWKNKFRSGNCHCRNSANLELASLRLRRTNDVLYVRGMKSVAMDVSATWKWTWWHVRLPHNIINRSATLTDLKTMDICPTNSYKLHLVKRRPITVSYRYVPYQILVGRDRWLYLSWERKYSHQIFLKNEMKLSLIRMVNRFKVYFCLLDFSLRSINSL